MGLEKLSKMQVGIGCCISLQIYAMPLNEQKQNQSDLRQSVPFWKTIAGSVQRKKLPDGIPNQSTSTKTIPSKIPAGVQSLGTRGGKIAPNQSTSTKTIPSKVPAGVQSLGTRGGGIVPNQSTSTKTSPSKIPAGVQSLGTQGGGIVPNQSTSTKTISSKVPAGVQSLGTKGGGIVPNQSTSTRTIPSKIPAGVQSLETRGEKIVPNQSTSTKTIPSKVPAVVQNSSGKREDLASVPAVKKDNARGASLVPSEVASSLPGNNITATFDGDSSERAIILSKEIPAVVQSSSGKGEDSVPAVEKDSARGASLVPSEVSSLPENDIAATYDGDSSERITIPTDYKLHNVPGDGLCGYWATLVARKAKEADDETSVRVERKEVFELLGQLSDHIAYTVKKEDKTDQETEMVNEIDQLLRDGYAKDYEDLCQRIEKGQMQLDSPLAVFLAQVIGYNIILEWEGIKSGQSVHVQELYRANNAQGTIIIYYSGNGSGGHYQAIIPGKISVIFSQGF
jgi:hypothetical protein